MPRPAALPALLALALALAGAGLAACGASRRPAQHTAAARASRRSTGATGALSSRQRALAFAAAVNLTATDLPGFTLSSEKAHHTSRERSAEQEMLRCTGSTGPGSELASASSKSFQLKRGLLDLGVSSEVAVARSSQAAAGELAAIRGSRIRACAARYLDQLLRGQRSGPAVAGAVSIQSGTPPAPGTSGGFGWRITAPLSFQGVKISFYVDILGFVYGQARVSLFSSGALLPFPAAVQQRLFMLLLERARAHGA